MSEDKFNLSVEEKCRFTMQVKLVMHETGCTFEEAYKRIYELWFEEGETNVQEL